MEKFRKAAEKKLTTKMHPEAIAREALINSEFSKSTRNDFFDTAYGEIMVQYFLAWLNTQPHETKSREFLYSAAMALGDVKSKLISMETYGQNVPTMQDMAEGVDSNE